MNNKYSNIRERILFFAEKEGVSVRKFSQKAGFSHSLLHNATQLGSDKLEKILFAYPALNPEWLLTGSGSMLREGSETSSSQGEERPGVPYAQKSEWLETGQSVKGIPLVREDALTGFGREGFQLREEEVERFYMVPDFEGADFLIRVKGDGMYPKYSGGDLLACRIIREGRFMQWNKCYVLSSKDQGVLYKRIRKGSGSEVFLAISENPECEPFEIPVSEVKGIALVIGVIRIE